MGRTLRRNGADSARSILLGSCAGSAVRVVLMVLELGVLVLVIGLLVVLAVVALRQ